MNRISWKEIVLGTIAGLSILTSPAVGQMSSTTEAPTVRVDNRGPGSLNSGRNGGEHSGTRDRDRTVVAQAAGDLRQEDRREDRRQDRQMDRREDRQLDRRENRQADRVESGRDNTRSNAGGELRGLDRADFAAGEHGREGRENAREAQMDRPNRPERMERMERHERMERADRPERPERPERPDKPERSGRN